MKIGQQIRFIVVNQQANSLYSLIADGQYRNTSLGRDTWKSLIGSNASLQYNCNKEGFNAGSDWRFYFSRAEQESVSLVTIGPTALNVAPELGLVLEGGLITATHVETLQDPVLIMVKSASRPWGTSWCSKKKTPQKKILFVEVFLLSRWHSICLFGRQSDSSSLWAAVCTLTLKSVPDYK